MDNHIIMVEKVPSVENLFQDLAVISDTSIRITSKSPVRITSQPKVAPLIITTPGPIPYSQDKVIPWNNGSSVYYHGVKQELPTTEYEGTEVVYPDIDNIVGTRKVTRRGRVFSPEISPNTVTTPVRVTATESVTEARGKEQMREPSQTKAPKEVTTDDTSRKELEEILKIIHKSDYKIFEQLGHTPSKISMLSLLLYSEAHAQALVKFLKTAHVPQEISVD